MKPLQVLPLRVRVDLGVIAMKKYPPLQISKAKASVWNAFLLYPGHDFLVVVLIICKKSADGSN